MIDNSALGEMGQAAGQSYTGVPIQDSAILTALGHMPAVTVSAGWNAHRISNTILGGGFNERGFRQFAPWRRNKAYGLLRNNNPFSIQNWGRLSTVSQVHGYNDSYTPANFMANSANKLFTRYVSSNPESGFARYLSGSGVDLDDRNLMQSGMLGKLSAASKLSNSKLGRGKYNSVMKYLEANDADLFKHLTARAPAGAMEDVIQLAARSREAGTQMSQLVSMAGQHTGTQLIGGYLAGARAPLTEMSRHAAEATGKNAFIKGAEKATRHLSLGGFEAGERMGVKGFFGGLGRAFAGSAGGEITGEVGLQAALRFGGAGAAKAAGLLIPGLNIVLAAKMAADVATVGMDLAKGAVDTAKDSIVSMKGTIDKPIMGMGFRDNEVAATSRARGVQAIQNSRLNARSVLGAEAASMHAHFG